MSPNVSIVKCASLILLLGCSSLPQAHASAPARQYYGAWSYHSKHEYYYATYYFKPTADYPGYRSHYAIYYASRPRYVYYFDRYSRRYWGRFDTEGKAGAQYSLLKDESRKERVEDIAEEDFPKPGGMPMIPESEDGVSMIPIPGLPKVEPEAVLLRTSAYRSARVSLRFEALPEPRKSKTARTDASLVVGPVRDAEPDESVAKEADVIVGSGRLLAIWIATRAREAGFQSVVMETDPRLRGGASDAETPEGRTSFRVNGDVLLLLERRLDREERTVGFTANIVANLRVASPGGAEVSAERWAVEPVSMTGTAVDQARTRRAAIVDALDRLTDRFLAETFLQDEWLEEASKGEGDGGEGASD